MQEYEGFYATGLAALVARRPVHPVEVLEQALKRVNALNPALNAVSPVTTGYAAALCGADYLDSVGKIHAYGGQMAHFFTQHDLLLSATLAEPPAKVGRFAHITDDYLTYRPGSQGIFAYSPFCAGFNAPGQTAASVPLYWTADGLPVGIHLASAAGIDEVLISLGAELEQAQPCFHRRPSSQAPT